MSKSSCRIVACSGTVNNSLAISVSISRMSDLPTLLLMYWGYWLYACLAFVYLRGNIVEAGQFLQLLKEFF
ncbi:hypothetical protein SLEP1_g17370 [Rubroshorea leprosula]|uniref:Uncharacterized protein n=1 Tax=Rubroshorea leprosula TaxID=152421 RepID=A0AAV5J381_9ROSI|nr:hypothetical protein SLEP1_g17370 [Rubroshorea leprosula]